MNVSELKVVGTVLWSGERVCVNPVIAIPTKKIINTELFIDGTTALYIWETQIRDAMNESTSGTSWFKD